jgi:hypothetical protein
MLIVFCNINLFAREVVCFMGSVGFCPNEFRSSSLHPDLKVGAIDRGNKLQ